MLQRRAYISIQSREVRCMVLPRSMSDMEMYRQARILLAVRRSKLWICNNSINVLALWSTLDVSDPPSCRPMTLPVVCFRCRAVRSAVRRHGSDRLVSDLLVVCVEIPTPKCLFGIKCLRNCLILQDYELSCKCCA